jgi:hypothetical protein
MAPFPKPKNLLVCLLTTLLLGIFIGMSQIISLPQTGYAPAVFDGAETLPSLDQFKDLVKNGQGNTVAGVYVPGVLALPVDQQPKDNAGFVTRESDQVTQFNLAGRYGTVGILAHNDLAGAEFSAIQLNQSAIVVYGDGHENYYRTTEIQKYQALSPTSTFSDFINLDGSGERLTAGNLFTRIYGPGKRLVFQTCIDAHGDSSWGRLFIIAEPVVYPVQTVMQHTSFLREFASYGMAFR